LFVDAVKGSKASGAAIVIRGGKLRDGNLDGAIARREAHDPLHPPSVPKCPHRCFHLTRPVAVTGGGHHRITAQSRNIAHSRAEVGRRIESPAAGGGLDPSGVARR
jgi:hypothetical protein